MTKSLDQPVSSQSMCQNAVLTIAHMTGISPIIHNMCSNLCIGLSQNWLCFDRHITENMQQSQSLLRSAKRVVVNINIYDYITVILDGRIKSDDMCLMFSINEAQLYTLKAFDCWIYIQIALDHVLCQRYKKKFVLPSRFISGPNKPNILDSFIYSGLYHVAVIMTEGLKIWDAAQELALERSAGASSFRDCAVHRRSRVYCCC